MKQEQKKNIQYDEHAKDILSQKDVLTYLKFTIAEFQNMDSAEIAELIEGEPLVSKVSVEPGETNRTFHGRLLEITPKIQN